MDSADVFFQNLQQSFMKWSNQQKEELEKLKGSNLQEIKELQSKKLQLEEEYKLLKTKGMQFPKIITLNVGGKNFSTSQATLVKDANSMLGVMFSGRHEITLQEDGSVFIDRDPKFFRYIINFLRDNKIDLTDPKLNINDLETESNYYQLTSLIKLIKEHRDNLKKRKRRKRNI